MTSDLILQISNLSKSFGAIQALRDVRFELRKGEVRVKNLEEGTEENLPLDSI